ncbi:hypothetical protein A9Q74_05380 [Colwellia sp. 39_35_sub15_T18]|nr:hypothetical protein A9Q74_05380 [Colwellia sp. 39_35_sub15_T18]
MLYIYVTIGVLFLVNISVCIFISKRDDLEDIQKIMQMVFVWAIPFLGALFFWRINRNHDVVTTQSKSFGGGARSNGYDSAGDGGSD